MAHSSFVPIYSDSAHYALKELLIAQDFSEAANSCLKYAVMLAKRFGSFIHLISVQVPTDYSNAMDAGPLAMELAQGDLKQSLKGLEERLREDGIWADSIRRIGNVSDTLEGAVLEHTPDLLLLGAFGYGPADRQRLGSTTEHLLRAVRCPVLIVGPRALLQDRQAPPIRSILCAVTSGDSPGSILSFAGHFATMVGASLECVHVIDAAHTHVPNAANDHQCSQWAADLRDHGIPVNWTAVHGRADEALAMHAVQAKSSLILFGLHRTGTKHFDCPDGVVSATIREAPCPVMTVPVNFLHRTDPLLTSHVDRRMEGV